MAVQGDVWERILRTDEGDLPPEVAEYFLSLTIPDEDKSRYAHLSAMEHYERSRDEEAELARLVEANLLLMLLQSKARLSLKSRQPAA
jgi:hypothetical protein